jgi:hypothetical protein
LPQGFLKRIFSTLPDKTMLKKHFQFGQYKSLNKYHLFIASCFIILLSSCSTSKDFNKGHLKEGRYLFYQKGENFKKVDVYIKNDTLNIFLKEDPHKNIEPDPTREQLYIKQSFDVDIVTVLFKFRSATAAVPRQLTTDFNGNVFLGYRLDRFGINYKKNPVGLTRETSHLGVGVGIIGGLGSTQITPTTTNYTTTDEYNGLVLSRGLALLVGINNLTVGIGLGWDYLTDRDKHIWVYQNRPWTGLTIGLNLN